MFFGAIAATILTLWIYVRVARKGGLHSETQGDFFFANWSLGRKDVGETIFSSSMSMASVVIALVQLTSVLGLGILFAVATFVGGWLLLGLLAPRIRQRTADIHTLHEFLQQVYTSRYLQLAASAATAIGLTGLFASELFAVGTLLDAIKVPAQYTTWTIAFFGVVACVHAANGGLRGVVGTDRIQNRLLAISIITLVGLALYGWVNAGTPNPLVQIKSSGAHLSWALGLSLFLVNVPYPLVDATAWQRLIATRSVRDFVAGTHRASLGFTISWCIVISVGLLALTFTAKDQSAFLTTVHQADALGFVISAGIGCLLFPGFVSAMLSSADAFLNGASHSIALDFSRTAIDPTQAVPATARRRVFYLGIAGLFGSLGLRGLGFDIVSLVFAISAGALSMLPSILGGLFLPRTLLSTLPGKSFAFVSVAAGFLSAWTVGILAVSGYNTVLPAFLESLSAYDTPIVAIVVSLSIYIPGIIIAALARVRD